MAKQTDPLPFVWSWPHLDVSELNPTMVVVSREPDGRWYVTFAVDTDAPEPAEPAGEVIGVDLGVQYFAALSTGEAIANPQHLERKARNLARYQRMMARKQRGSNNRSGLNRRVLDAAMGEFRRQLEYKTERAGKRLIVIDRWHPSSKTCSNCGHLLSSLKLSVRAWTRPHCRTRHDRDINAAKNILAAGQAVAGNNPGQACGAGIRRQGPSLPQPATKQEPSGAIPKAIPALQCGE